jgi:hypothetical protein
MEGAGTGARRKTLEGGEGVQREADDGGGTAGLEMGKEDEIDFAGVGGHFLEQGFGQHGSSPESTSIDSYLILAGCEENWKNKVLVLLGYGLWGNCEMARGLW